MDDTFRPEFISEEQFFAAEFASDWACGNMWELDKKKYWKDFSLLQYKVRLWVGENRDRIRDLETLEEVEELMIADGIITREQCIVDDK